MESFLDFILSNIFLIVVVVGGLISYISRIAKGPVPPEQQRTTAEQPQSQPQPHAQTEGQGRGDWRDLFKQLEMELTGRSESKAAIEAKQEKEREAREALVEQEKLQQQYKELERKRARKIEKALNVETLNKQKEEKLDVNFNHISRSEAMKGIIWAEVLGPPRSKKQHQTYYRKS